MVLSIAEYRRLKAQRPSLADYLLAAPKLDDDIIDVINERPYDAGREIER